MAIDRLEIDLLKNQPQHIPTLAAWFKEASPEYFEGISLDTIARDHFAARLNENVLPISLIACESDMVIGTVALLEESITTHRHLGPWLGGLHVHPDFRHRGVGTQLIQGAVRKATALNLRCLYAGVSRAEEHYRSLGWEVIERTMYHGKALSIIRLDLAGAEW